MSAFEFFLISLAVWRVSYMLTNETGPFDVFYRIRQTRLVNLLSCMYCTSVWVSAVFTAMFFADWRQAIVLCLSLSGFAILIEESRRRIEV